MAIRFFDMFAGIGGFRSGLEAVGGFECVKEVKRLNGGFSFEDALAWQKG